MQTKIEKRHITTRRNVTLSEKHREPATTPQRSDWECKGVAITPQDKQRLARVMIAELGYYNRLVETMNARLRAQPDLLTSITPEWERLYCAVAALGQRISYPLRFDMLDAELNAEFARPLATDDELTRRTKDRLSFLVEAMSHPARLHPDTRRGMASEIIKYYRLQANAAIRKSTDDEQSYQSVHETLEVLESQRKRHVQLLRPSVRIAFDEAENKSLLSTPYTEHPIEIHGIDFTKNSNWNHVLIHQAGGAMPRLDTPWSVVFRRTPNLYLIKLTESNNPYWGSAFQQAKSGRK